MEIQPLNYSPVKKQSVGRRIKNFISGHKKSLLVALVATATTASIATNEAIYDYAIGKENTWRVNRVIPLWNIDSRPSSFSMYTRAPTNEGYLTIGLFHLYNQGTRIGIDKYVNTMINKRGYVTYFEINF
jgi:hypothetical protein